MSDQGVFLSKWPPNWRIILAKEQLGHCYIFWTMPILIFCQFANFGNQSLFYHKYCLENFPQFSVVSVLQSPQNIFITWKIKSLVEILGLTFISVCTIQSNIFGAEPNKLPIETEDRLGSSWFSISCDSFEYTVSLGHTYSYPRSPFNRPKLPEPPGPQRQSF